MENALSLRTGHFRLCHSLLHTIPQAFSSQSVFFRGHFSRYTKIKGAVTRNQLSSFFSWFLRFLTPHFLGQTVKMIIPTPIKKEDEPSPSLAEFGSAVVCPVFRTRCTASRRLMGAFLAIRLEVFCHCVVSLCHRPRSTWKLEIKRIRSVSHGVVRFIAFKESRNDISWPNSELTVIITDV